MEYDELDALRARHPAWRLLRADHAPLVLAFLGAYFVDANRGPTAATAVATALDDAIYALDPDPEQRRFPRPPLAYLEDWSGAEVGWVRRFYPAGSDEVHYEVTPSFERAFAWVTSLRARSFVGTESRLHTVVELLRQIVQGSETDPAARLVELRRRRDEIDAEIAAVESGEVRLLDSAGVRDRYQQVSSIARELLSDFRQVEENFRGLDRAARERIAAWEGGKGALLAELVSDRADISTSDQGRSFQAFHDFLLSESRQDELSGLLTAATAALAAIDASETDHRLRTVHHEWSEAAERTQRTVRQITEQLRRFLDDQVWLENRRVLDLVRAVETSALAVRDRPPDVGLEVDVPGIDILLPFERPLYDARPAAEVESLRPPAADVDLDTELLFAQRFVDQVRLAEHIRAVVPERSSALLSDIVAFYPIEQGAAEIIGYLALDDEALHLEMDDTEETVLDYAADGTPKRARLPRVTVRRA